jgi:diaminopimelate decarboxylase
LTLEGTDLGAIAECFGTPCYVTSEGQIRANYRRLHEAFTELYPATRLLYANKANNNFAVRRILAQEGAGGDCFGLGELTLCLQAGVRCRSPHRRGRSFRAGINNCGKTG